MLARKNCCYWSDDRDFCDSDWVHSPRCTCLKLQTTGLKCQRADLDLEKQLKIYGELMKQGNTKKWALVFEWKLFRFLDVTTLSTWLWIQNDWGPTLLCLCVCESRRDFTVEGGPTLKVGSIAQRLVSLYWIEKCFLVNTKWKTESRKRN